MDQLKNQPAEDRPLRVVMVTGAYYPEVSGAGLQCRALAHAASVDGKLECRVIATAVDRTLPTVDDDNGVRVLRLPAGGIFTLVTRWLPRLKEISGEISRCDFVHLHGFSRKSYLLMLLARRHGKKVIIKLSSLGEDDPASVRRAGGLRWKFYRRADLYLAPSPALADAYRASELPEGKLRELPNGVDTDRFSPADHEEKLRLRRELGLSEDGLALVSLGHFSSDKRLDFLARTWSRLESTGGPVHLWLVGENRTGAYEVDSTVAATVNKAATNPKRPGELATPGRVNNPEDWLRAADIFVLPSIREGLPNSLLEAMSCALPCVAARLEGITDRMLNYGSDQAAGMLFIPDNPKVLAAAIGSLAAREDLRLMLGERARKKVEEEYRMEAVAERYICVINDLTVAD